MQAPPSPDSARTQLQERLRDVRTSAGRASIRAFAKIYLGSHFSLPPSRMHLELFELLEEATAKRGSRIAIAAPRGHAKSTVVSLAFVLWAITFGLERFVVLISNTADQAADLLAAVKYELESNPLLLADFPEVAEPPGVKPAPKRWRKTDIITRNGIKVMALGAGQKIRGRKHVEHRPTLLILDDVENDEEAISADQRESKREWFTKAVMKAGTTAQTNVLVVGTILHYDALLARLTGEKTQSETCPGWTSRKYQAVLAFSEREDLWQRWEEVYTYRTDDQGQQGPDAAMAFFEANRVEMLKGTSVLWAAREDYVQLMELRLREGRASFDGEKQNEPTDPASAYFDIDKMIFWDDTYKSVDELLRNFHGKGRVYGACDPSLGRAGQNRDFTAIVSILKDPDTGVLYVIDADISKRKPHESIKAIIEYARVRDYSYFAFEVNQFQDLMANDLERLSRVAGVHVPVRKVTHSSDKLGRIQTLEPMISMGTLRFSRRHRVLLEQLRQFPKAAHDDGPDALEMAITVSRTLVPRITWVKWHI